MLCDSSRDSDSSPFYSDSSSRVQFFFHFDSDLDSEIVTHDSGSSHARVQAVTAVPCCNCLLWHSMHFVVCFHVLEDKQMLNMWTTRFVTRTRNVFYTRTLRWWLGLGLGLRGDDSDSDSDLTTWTRTQHCSLWFATCSCTHYDLLVLLPSPIHDFMNILKLFLYWVWSVCHGWTFSKNLGFEGLWKVAGLLHEVLWGLLLSVL